MRVARSLVALSFIALSFIAPSLVGLLFTQPAVAQAPQMAAHHATYRLTLDAARGDVVAAKGAMDYEMTDACDGWATKQRLELTVTNEQGQDVQTVTDYATWESKDGLEMRFRKTELTDTAITEQVEGTARLERVGGTGSVHYVKPAEATAALPAGTVFPTAHTERIIAAAQAGQKFITLPIFDGTGDKGAQDSSVVISNWNPPGAAPDPALARLPSGRMRIAFFPRGGASQKPDFEVGMKYWANGVSDDLIMDFEEFVMRGRLDSFTLTPGHC